jgi:protein TonB
VAIKPGIMPKARKIGSRYAGGMEDKHTFSRIRCSRRSTPREFTVQAHRASHLIAFAEPEYPVTAKTRGIEGTVVLDAVIDRDGAITEVSVRTGHPLLAESALETVRHWRYRPTTVNGIPVEVQTDMEVKFTLPDSVVSS